MKSASRRVAVMIITALLLQGMLPHMVSYAQPTAAAQEPAAFALPTGRVGLNYEYQLRTEGGLAPFTWRIVSGELPPGLSLDATGKLNGTATATRREAYQFTVEVADASSQRAELPCILTMQAAPLRIVTGPSKLRIIPSETPTSARRQEPTANSPAPTAPVVAAEQTPSPAAEKPQPMARLNWPYVPRARSQSDVLEATPPAGRTRYSSIAKPRSTDADTTTSSRIASDKRADNFDPAKFVRIYEAPKNREVINPNYGKLVYDPSDPHDRLKTTRLDIDESSTLIIVPGWDLMDLDMPLNNLFITAELSSGDKKTPLEVIGYSEIGKSQNAALAQQGMAFQSTKNIIAMMLNLAYTDKDILNRTYGDITGKDVSMLPMIESDPAKNDPLRDKARAAFSLLGPEIKAIATYMQDRKNLNLVEIIGTEVFWIDRASMEAIAAQYLKNLSDAFDSNVQKEAQNVAIRDMIERTKLVYEDLEDPMTEINILTRDTNKFRVIANRDFDETTKELVERLKIVQQEITAKGLDYERDWNNRLVNLARSLAVQIYAQQWGERALFKLRKLFTPGYLSLDGARAKDGDRVTIKVEARSSDVEGPGIPAYFEVTVKKLGVKFQIGSSFMFIKRLGLDEADLVQPPDGPGLKEINFAPSPGMTMGLTFFKRGDSGADKLMRAIAPTLGLNVSFMNFNDPGFDLSTGMFTNTTGTNVQVGAGPLVSFFNNKLHFTYGWNLNADKKRNYFGVGFGFLEIADFLKNKLKSSDQGKQ